MQGFGNVGNEAAYLFSHAQAKIVCVQDHTGTIFNPEGLSVKALQKHVTEHGGVMGFAEAQVIADEDFWDVDMDILIPAALEGQITVERAQRLKAKIVLEGANGFAEGFTVFGILHSMCKSGFSARLTNDCYQHTFPCQFFH